MKGLTEKALDTVTDLINLFFFFQIQGSKPYNIFKTYPLLDAVQFADDEENKDGEHDVAG